VWDAEEAGIVLCMAHETILSDKDQVHGPPDATMPPRRISQSFEA